MLLCLTGTVTMVMFAYHAYSIAGFFKGKFASCENFTLEIFTLGINKMVLFNYFKVQTCERR